MSTNFKLLIHSATQSQTVVISIFTHVVRVCLRVRPHVSKISQSKTNFKWRLLLLLVGLWVWPTGSLMTHVFPFFPALSHGKYVCTQQQLLSPQPLFQLPRREPMKKSGSSISSVTPKHAYAGSAAEQRLSANTLAAPPNVLHVRRRSAPDPSSPDNATDGKRKGGARASISPPTGSGAGLLFVGGSKSATTSPVGGAPSVSVVGNGSAACGAGAAGSAAAAAGGDKSGSPRHRTSNDAWVCPNDRQLALRAK